jgi:hypothetical protein
MLLDSFTGFMHERNSRGEWRKYEMNVAAHEVADDARAHYVAGANLDQGHCISAALQFVYEETFRAESVDHAQAAQAYRAEDARRGRYSRP